MQELFKTIPLTLPVKNPDYYSKKYQTETKAVGGAWFLEEKKKNHPLIKRKRLSKKYKEEKKPTKKSLWEANNSCNNWKLQLHWNKL